MTDRPARTLPRRKFLQAMALTAAAPLVLSACRALPRNPTPLLLDSTLPLDLTLNDDTPAATRALFDSSVASADPSPSGVIIWTHLNPELLVSGLNLYFQVAYDRNFNDIVIDGFVDSEDISAERDHTVAIDLDGQLEPLSTYYYRFIYNNISSRTGRCKTAPAEDANLSQLTFAVLSCQDYTNGYYGALNHMAADDQLDYVIHLGDFIYETVGDPRFQDLPFADRLIELPSGREVCMDLADYRHTYKSYRSDRNLQIAMERFTWIVTTDDHETSNDCYWDYERDTLGAPDHPLTLESEFGNDPERLKQLKLDSQRAWLEWVPARVQVEADADHPHHYSRIYRKLQFGQLLQLHMLDTRSYRSAHPCGEKDIGERYASNTLKCEALAEPLDSAQQTLLGAQQKQWLFNNLTQDNARWQVLGNQTFLGKLAAKGQTGTLYVNVDAWDGFASERSELLNLVREDVDNLVVLTGDLHSYIASHLADNTDLKIMTDEDILGVEFMSPSLTSAGLVDMASKIVKKEAQKDAVESLAETFIKFNNAHIEFFNTLEHGYSSVTFTQNHCDWRAYAISKDIKGQNNARWQLAAYRKAIGKPRLQVLS